MLSKVNALLPVIFFDNAFWSGLTLFVLITILAVKRWSSLPLPRSLAIAVWWFLVLAAAAVTVFLVAQFFSYQKGIERLAVLVVFLGTTPLLIAALLAIFIFRLPNKC